MRANIISRILGILLSLACISFSVNAGSDDYQVYTDGNDIYLVSDPVFIILHGDVVVPLEVMPEGGVIRLIENGGSWTAQSLSLSEYRSLSNSLVLSNDYVLQFVDFESDGRTDFWLRATSRSDDSLLVLSTSLTVSNLGEFGYINSNDEFADVNGDGILDQKFGLRILLGTPNGNFIETGKLGTISATQIGLTGGEFRVSESGAATYSIPLTLPAGTAGVAPQVSLNYNSQAGNGPLGMGWSLSAASAITRCPQTFAQDGKIDGIHYDQRDRFCLDGQKLIPDGNTSNIGLSNSDYANASAYHTEIDSFAQITSHGGSEVKGPESFVVETKSGETHYYGFLPEIANMLPDSGDAFVEPGGGGFCWSWPCAHVGNQGDQGCRG